MIVRRHGSAELARNRDIAADEFRVLDIAHRRGLKAPKPYDVDESRELFPAPVIVIEYVEGETIFSPANLSDYVRQAAEELARIHVTVSAAEVSFLAEVGRGFGDRPETLDESLSEGAIRDALEAVWPLPRANEPALLHGDYWPGNLLWKDGHLAAVIDWEDARVGDPLADLGNSRLEFLFFFGFEAMDDLTRRYLREIEVDATTLPYWDLCAALRPCSKLAGWGLEPSAEQQMRERHREFVAQALARLPN